MRTWFEIEETDIYLTVRETRSGAARQPICAGS